MSSKAERGNKEKSVNWKMEYKKWPNLDQERDKLRKRCTGFQGHMDCNKRSSISVIRILEEKAKRK